jgi:hypothetical protein
MADCLSDDDNEEHHPVSLSLFVSQHPLPDAGSFVFYYFTSHGLMGQ